MVAVLAAYLGRVSAYVLELQNYAPVYASVVFLLCCGAFSLATKSGWGWCYWLHVWGAWMTVLVVLPVSRVLWFAGYPWIRLMNDTGEGIRETVELMVLALCANRLWRAQANTTTPFWIVQMLAGPSMILSKLVLEIDDGTSTDPTFKTSFVKCMVALGWVSPFCYSCLPGAEMFRVEWMGMTIWTIRVLCTSLLILSVLELNVVFNISFSGFVWRQLKHSPIPKTNWLIVCTLAWRLFNFAVAAIVLALAVVVSLPLAWTIHLLWIAADL